MVKLAGTRWVGGCPGRQGAGVAGTGWLVWSCLCPVTCHARTVPVPACPQHGVRTVGRVPGGRGDTVGVCGGAVVSVPCGCGGVSKLDTAQVGQWPGGGALPTMAQVRQSNPVPGSDYGRPSLQSCALEGTARRTLTPSSATAIRRRPGSSGPCLGSGPMMPSSATAASSRSCSTYTEFPLNRRNFLRRLPIVMATPRASHRP